MKLILTCNIGFFKNTTVDDPIDDDLDYVEPTSDIGDDDDKDDDDEVDHDDEDHDDDVGGSS
jgi:hypothetical protein